MVEQVQCSGVMGAFAGVNAQPGVGYEEGKHGWYWGEYGDDKKD